MPPKFKFTREQIIAVAFGLAREQGLTAVTARAIAGELCASPKVIFSLFNDMGEVRQAVLDAAQAKYNTYINRALTESLPFKSVGTAYIKFATDEPKLFQLLFMQEKNVIPQLPQVLNLIEDNYEAILQSIITSYDLPRDAALVMYQHLWLYTHGIATLIATKVCVFTTDEISQKLTEVFTGLLLTHRKEKNND